MDIETAKNIKSLIDTLSRQEDKLESINKTKEMVQMTKGALDGHLIICDTGFKTDISISAREIFDMLDFLSSYWTIEKFKTMKEIEKL